MFGQWPSAFHGQRQHTAASVPMRSCMHLRASSAGASSLCAARAGAMRNNGVIRCVCSMHVIYYWLTTSGTWCSGITPAQHAGGPGFNPQCVHLCPFRIHRPLQCFHSGWGRTQENRPNTRRAAGASVQAIRRAIGCASHGNAHAQMRPRAKKIVPGRLSTPARANASARTPERTRTRLRAHGPSRACRLAVRAHLRERAPGPGKGAHGLCLR